MPRYLATFDPDFERRDGAARGIAAALQKLGVTVHIERGADAQAYTVTHNATIYVIDPEARLAAVFGPPHDAHAIASDYERIRQLPQRLRRATPSVP